MLGAITLLGSASSIDLHDVLPLPSTSEAHYLSATQHDDIDAASMSPSRLPALPIPDRTPAGTPPRGVRVYHHVCIVPTLPGCVSPR